MALRCHHSILSEPLLSLPISEHHQICNNKGISDKSGWIFQNLEAPKLCERKSIAQFSCSKASSYSKAQTRRSGKLSCNCPIKFVCKSWSILYHTALVPKIVYFLVVGCFMFKMNWLINCNILWPIVDNKCPKYFISVDQYWSFSCEALWSCEAKNYNKLK